MNKPEVDKNYYEELEKEKEFLIDLLIEVAEGSHKCKRLFDWYCKYSTTGKFDDKEISRE